MTSIGVVAHFAYGAMTGGHGGHVGGVERQTSLMCRWLAGRGHRVSLITWNEGQADEVEIAKVRVIKLCRKDAGLPGLRFFHPRWTSLMRAMAKVDADLYYQNCAECVTGQVALWCQSHDRGFVYSVASDFECAPSLPTLTRLRERVLYRYGLRRADRIIAQTERQRQMLRDGFGLDAIVLPMPCPGPADIDYCPPEPPSLRPCQVLWVGRIAREKRLELVLGVARLLPEVHFHVVGKSNAGAAYSEDLLRQARAQPNVTIHGIVSRDRMVELYQRASLLCCTSLYEGFPNTFLEAWSHGLPIVSTVDPDDLIIRRNLGFTAADVNGLVLAIRRLVQEPARWREMSSNARRYYAEQHRVDAAMSRFEQVFLEVRRTD